MNESEVLSLARQAAIGVEFLGYQLGSVDGRSFTKSGYTPGTEPTYPGFGILSDSSDQTLGSFIAIFWFEKIGAGWRAHPKGTLVIEVKGRSNMSKMQALATEISSMCKIKVSTHLGTERTQREISPGC